VQGRDHRAPVTGVQGRPFCVLDRALQSLRGVGQLRQHDPGPGVVRVQFGGADVGGSGLLSQRRKSISLTHLAQQLALQIAAPLDQVRKGPR
jgi:hypothetical protein